MRAPESPMMLELDLLGTRPCVHRILLFIKHETSQPPAEKEHL